MAMFYSIKNLSKGLVNMNLADYKESLTKISEIIYFDNNKYLREKTSDPLKLKQFINEAESLLQSCGEEERYFLQGTLGNLYRINKQPKKAISFLTDHLNQAITEKNITREIVALIRLGEAHKYDGNHPIALELFNDALEKCKSNKIDEYLDFVWQHKGKCLMELARLTEAEECFQAALRLRNEKGIQSLIESTEQAIRLVKDLQMAGQ